MPYKEVEIELDDFTDDELLEEIRSRRISMAAATKAAADDLLIELQGYGLPERLLDEVRDYLKRPEPDAAKLARWIAWAKGKAVAT